MEGDSRSLDIGDRDRRINETGMGDTLFGEVIKNSRIGTASVTLS